LRYLSLAYLLSRAFPYLIEALQSGHRNDFGKKNVFHFWNQSKKNANNKK